MQTVVHNVKTMKKIFFLLWFFSQLSYAQIENKDYELYNLILSDQLNFGTDTNKDTIVLIEQFHNKLDRNFQIFDTSADTLTKLDQNFILINTNRDTTFFKRLISNPNLKKELSSLTSDFQNHPKLDAQSFHNKNVHITTIPSKKYHSFFGKDSKNKIAWKKIRKKYGTTNVVAFSNINYQGDFAAAYYELNCGGLCGTGNIVIFEKVGGKWKIMTEYNLWMS